MNQNKCNFYIDFIDIDVLLISINENNFSQIYYDLISSLFHSQSNNKFVSFTQTNDEISLFIDKDSITENLRNQKLNIDDDIYKVIEIHEFETGINHIGIVNKISSVFSKNNIPILYVNSFNKNFILVKKEDYDKVVEIVNDIYL
jgi:hypothetical protein